MKDLNSLSMIGRLTRPAEVRYTNSGYCIVSFSLAVKNSKKVNGNYEDVANFFDCSYFGKGAEAVSQYLQQGQQVSIQGHLEQQSWTDKNTNQKRSKVIVDVDNLWLLGGKSDSQQKPQQRQPTQQYQQQSFAQTPQPTQPVAPEDFQSDDFDSEGPF